MYVDNFFDDKHKDELLREISCSYEKIIKEINVLYKNLNLDNSIGKGLLFSYLLYNGYFSYNHKHTYSQKNIMDIRNSYSYDIFLGKGVCRHYSNMLNDILNYNSINSYCLLVHISNLKYLYQININIDEDKKSYFYRALKDFLNIINNRPNHLCNLIIENGNCFIYDATNMTVFELIDNKIAIHTMGNGRMKLFLEHEDNKFYNKHLIEFEDYVILDSDKLFNMFLRESFRLKEIVVEGSNILEDFHNDILSDINNIKAKVLEMKYNE